MRQSYVDPGFEVKFIDFSQRRKIGFRGAFEFDNKRILLASDSQIKILAFFQGINGDKLLDMAENNLFVRSKSPNSVLNKSKIADSQSTSTQDARGDHFQRQRTARSSSRNPEGSKGQGSSMVSFEIANFTLDDYPNEKIVFAKFLDDNDPRLLFVVTYNSELETTYMKVAKIEKSVKYFDRKVTESGGVVRLASVAKSNSSINLFKRRNSFSLIESQPITDLKKEILEYSSKKKAHRADNNPNSKDQMPPNHQFGFNPYENIKVTLKHSSPREQD